MTKEKKTLEKTLEGFLRVLGQNSPIMRGKKNFNHFPKLLSKMLFLLPKRSHIIIFFKIKIKIKWNRNFQMQFQFYSVIIAK